MTKIDVFDLIGTPYKFGGTSRLGGLDCRSLAWTAAARIPLVGLSSPEDAEQTTYDDVAAGRSRWRCIGDEVTSAKKIGHLVLVGGDGCPDAGVLMLVNEKERLFITTTKQRGHAFLVPARAVRDVLGVYEWEGSE